MLTYGRCFSFKQRVCKIQLFDVCETNFFTCRSCGFLINIQEHQVGYFFRDFFFSHFVDKMQEHGFVAQYSSEHTFLWKLFFSSQFVSFLLLPCLFLWFVLHLRSATRGTRNLWFCESCVCQPGGFVCREDDTRNRYSQHGRLHVAFLENIWIYARIQRTRTKNWLCLSLLDTQNIVSSEWYHHKHLNVASGSLSPST